MAHTAYRAAPQPGDRQARLLDRLLDAGHAPGVQYVVITAEQELLRYAGGWADLARQRPMDPDTTLMAYSMSKTFTAIAVLQLVESGALDLDAPAASRVAHWPYDAAVTTRQLLAHTSGLPNPLPLRWVHPTAAHDGFDEQSALDDVLRSHARQATRPGRRYRYSNIGYWLLGRLVEQVSGLAFTDYMRTHVFSQLQCDIATIGYAIPDPDRHARGYLERYSFLNLIKRFVIDRGLIGATNGHWVNIRDHYVNGNAFRGMVCTSRGVAAFLQDQLRSTSVLLGPQGRALLETPQRLSDGACLPMTLGWHVAQLAGQRMLYKEGGGGGFHTMMRLYPDAGVGTVLLTNATCLDIRSVMDELDQSSFALT